MLKSAAMPIDQLLRATFEAESAMLDYADYFDLRIALRNEINEIFDFPVLLAALDRLEYLVELRTRASVKMNLLGYTADDAITLSLYKKEKMSYVV